MKKKILLAVALSIALTLGVFAAAYVVINSYTTSVSVNEAFNTTNTSMAFTAAFPGENRTANVSVFNNATSRLRANLSWIELSNPSAVIYTLLFVNSTDGGLLNSSFYVDAQNTETRTIVWAIDSASPTGTVTGQHNISRIRIE